ncbi:MAG TPA: lipopolysaccharide heptosyltransferase II [Candidatus Cloacimonas sp.]|nr:lipopolysaccharide heptosyltransferase II [Candidatus Cloacimonas sp.]HPS59866.1 lipopolysaccharide heptosyltransferase II [Candidatus Cloacimonas sp.]
MKEPQNILIVQTAFIGDVILITPLIRATAELYPQAKIDVMVVSEAAILLKNNHFVQEVIVDEKRKNVLLSTLQLIKQIKSKHYDLVISPHSSFRTHLILYLSKIPERIGFNRGSAKWMLTKRIEHPVGPHKIVKNLGLLKPLTDREFDLQTELFPSDKDKQKAEELLKALSGKTLIAIAPGSIWQTKCWQLKSYIALCRKLLDSGYGIILIGGESDKFLCEEIENSIPKDNAKLINLAGVTNLLESAAVIKKCSLMICNDSGAMHIANAMQTRVFAFFGPTVQRFGYYPYRQGDRVFEVDLDCRPCGSHGSKKCPQKHHNCMQKIEVEPVFAAVTAILK